MAVFNQVLEAHTLPHLLRMYKKGAFFEDQMQTLREVIQDKFILEDVDPEQCNELCRLLDDFEKRVNEDQQQDTFRRGSERIPHTSGSVIILLDTSSMTFKKFRLTGRRITFKYNNYDGLMTALTYIQRGLDEVLQQGMRDFNNDDRVGLVFSIEDFPDRPVAISFRRKDQLAADVILATPGKILQTNTAFFTTGVLTLPIDRVEMPRLSGNAIKLRGSTFEDL